MKKFRLKRDLLHISSQNAGGHIVQGTNQGRENRTTENVVVG